MYGSLTEVLHFDYLFFDESTTPSKYVLAIVSVTGAIQTVIDETLEKRLRRNCDGSARTPFEVMTGIRPNRKHIRIMMELDVTAFQHITRSETERMCIAEINQKLLVAMHEDVRSRNTARTQKAVAAEIIE